MSLDQKGKSVKIFYKTFLKEKRSHLLCALSAYLH